jgi:putative selenate reductase
LESNNFRNVFAEDQKQMYMSGKALHPLAVNLAAQIRKDFPEIDISFSAGADCFNIHELLACKLTPVTVSSDLLKPGGYGRLSQYLENLKEELDKKNFTSIAQLINENPSEKLTEYSASVADNPAYRKALREPNIKTLRPLNYFDCIYAPCMSTCPAEQNIPLYMHHTAKGNRQQAFEVIMKPILSPPLQALHATTNARANAHASIMIPPWLSGKSNDMFLPLKMMKLSSKPFLPTAGRQPLSGQDRPDCRVHGI